MAFVDDAYYDGSRLFAWLSIATGIPIDQINFAVTQILALLLAPLFRSYLHHAKATPATRHAFGLVVGLLIGCFAFGRLVQFQLLIMISGPLMVITQKVTSLAFSLHDGLTRKEEEMTTNQKHYAVRNFPTALEYFSYVLHFHTIMAGPALFYKDYIDFIHGYNFKLHPASSKNQFDSNCNSRKVVLEPSSTLVAVKKIIISVLCAALFVSLIPTFPIQRAKDDDFVEGKTASEQMVYLFVATILVRLKYYHAWVLADAICNLSGIGFNGYDSNGVAKWDLVSNVDILQFEFGVTLRDSIEHWNKGTNVWLRMTVYERVPAKYATLLTYALSAFWHGFYPGYYLTFASGALFTYASRAIRRCIRHYFQEPAVVKAFYDLVTMVATRVVMTYITFSFVLLEFWPSVRLYRSTYCWLHLAALAATLALPRTRRATKSTPLKNPFRQLSSNGVTSGHQRVECWREEGSFVSRVWFIHKFSVFHS
ncbi:LOW QUALITY PROTEIN: lysophospholipid acyltransferase 2 [Nilaparvata lugens]|uniref:LOW QUALITY PROTEIN: lysophospholipid acyltransferase 2 n=1 Tax=Nilaparvata lugens TaxID=108931 RepID=UPI00193EB7A7|nr:LOW QUALITY PROTEIN: lysophospholipid acyltransferase 2 [Nilaparvata lugens]